jgi:hypothetical protein
MNNYLVYLIIIHTCMLCITNNFVVLGLLRVIIIYITTTTNENIITHEDIK